MDIATKDVPRKEIDFTMINSLEKKLLHKG
jgi:hypothetical protein